MKEEISSVDIEILSFEQTKPLYIKTMDDKLM